GALLPTATSRVTIALVRRSERAQVDVDLPLAFELTVPSTPLTFADPIPLSWSPSQTSDAMGLNVSGPCLSTSLVRGFTSDTGSYVIEPGDLEVASTGCTLTVALSRWQPTRALGLAASSSNVTVTQMRA